MFDVLMVCLLWVVLSMLGGVLYRQRGGGRLISFVPDGLGTQGARLLWWALPTGLMTGLWTLNPWLGAAVFVTAFLGVALFGHGAHQRSGIGIEHEAVSWTCTENLTEWLPWVMGNYRRLSAGRKELWNWIGMSAINVVRISIILAPISIVYSDPFPMVCAIAGLFPAYYIGWRAPGPIIPDFLDGGSTFGELITGSVMWSAIVLALLIST